MDARALIGTIALLPVVFAGAFVMLGVGTAMLRMTLQYPVAHPSFILIRRRGWRANFRAAFEQEQATFMAPPHILLVVGGHMMAMSIAAMPSMRFMGVALAIGAVTGLLRLRRAYVAITRPVTRRLVLNRFAKARMAVAVFVYRCWSANAWLAGGIAVLFWLQRAAFDLRLSETVVVLSILPAYLAVVPLILWADRGVQAFWLGAAVQVQIQDYLDRGRRGVKPTLPELQLLDPRGADRRALAEIAQSLARLADRFERRLPPVARPHPMASLLRAVVHRIRFELTNARSMFRSGGPEMERLLVDVATALAGPRRATVHLRLAKSTEAFAAEGSPSPESAPAEGAQPHNAFARVVAAIDTSNKVVTTVVTVLVLVVTVYLVLAGELGLDALLKLQP